MHYIVFPGNVGDKDALARVAMKLGVKKLSDVSATVTDKPTRTSTSKPEESKMLNALKEAQQKGYALAAFNVYNLEGAKAVVDKAEALGSPAILQVHPSSLNFGGRALIDMLISFRTYSKVPIFVHLDHSTDEKDVELALRCGVDSIMVDGSAMPLDENISWTKKMTELAHAQGVIVEAELGRLAGKEDGLEISEKESKMTNPNEAKVFVKETNVDMLAVTIGNVHGKYSRPPSLDFDRLSAIKNNVPINLPLVLHGASGLPSNLISQSIRQGVCKFNVNTDIRDAFMRNTRYLVSDVNIDMLEVMISIYSNF
jgi:tagatose 1,6-diphosphate aldolase GatY/KbaY